jgi:hypothetical protein
VGLWSTRTAIRALLAAGADVIARGSTTVDCEGRDRPLANVAAAVTDGARNGSRCLSIRWSDTGGCMPLAAALAALLSWPLEMDADEVAALGLRRRPDDGCTHSLGGSTFENV